MNLTGFVLARIEAREATARDMQDQARLGRPFFDTDSLAGGTGIRELIDPVHVLAECEAKRAIVELHYDPGHPETCLICAEYIGDEGEHDPMPCDTLRVMAAIYDTHPDYREEWKPRDLAAEDEARKAALKAAMEKWRAEHPLTTDPGGTIRRP